MESLVILTIDGVDNEEEAMGERSLSQRLGKED